ncbi:DUF6894 family protein [Bradyrhizobium australiense]|uniref:DUF6894 family protein n=1 Tax=Bradyrhizobium australiense TaxID=2721161 RepID=UPI0035E132EF
MPRYYFDIREGDELALDEEGLELSTIETAWVRPPTHWLTSCATRSERAVRARITAWQSSGTTTGPC